MRRDGLKILANAFAQVERLADVNHRAKPVAMQIHAGLVRHGAQFFADGITDWHGNNLQRKSIFGDEELQLKLKDRINKIFRIKSCQRSFFEFS
jgi:hypothetical protein